MAEGAGSPRGAWAATEPGLQVEADLGREPEGESFFVHKREAL
jgi:hypothetical protein